MQFLNFSVGGQNIDLEWPNGYADLHSNFDFTELRFEPAKAALRLSWRKSAGAWAKQEPWAELHLLFEDVDYLHVKPRDPAYPLSEDDCLANICLTPQAVRDEFANIYFNKDAQPDDDLTLFFQSEWGLKVNAATVRLELTPK